MQTFVERLSSHLTMHVSADRRRGRPRNRALVLVALVALAVVAIASTGHVPSGTDHTRRPAPEIADTLGRPSRAPDGNSSL